MLIRRCRRRTHAVVNSFGLSLVVVSILGCQSAAGPSWSWMVKSAQNEDADSCVIVLETSLTYPGKLDSFTVNAVFATTKDGTQVPMEHHVEIGADKTSASCKLRGKCRIQEIKEVDLGTDFEGHVSRLSVDNHYSKGHSTTITGKQLLDRFDQKDVSSK